MVIFTETENVLSEPEGEMYIFYLSAAAKTFPSLFCVVKVVEPAPKISDWSFDVSVRNIHQLTSIIVSYSNYICLEDLCTYMTKRREITSFCLEDLL